MTYPGVNTLTRTAAITMVDVRHVMWRIQSDLCALRVHHGMIDLRYEEETLYDLTLLVLRGFISRVEFRFVDSTYGTRRYAVRYDVDRNRGDVADDESGGLRWQDLRGTWFQTFIVYTAAYRMLTQSQQAALRAELKTAWGPAADVADGAGQWISDRTYGSGSLGAARSVFKAN
jgi:hypothetical protein